MRICFLSVSGGVCISWICFLCPEECVCVNCLALQWFPTGTAQAHAPAALYNW